MNIRNCIFISTSLELKEINALLYISILNSYIDNDGRKINSFSVYEQTSINFCNIGSIWESSGKVTTRISFAGNPQKNSTGNMPAWIKFWDTSNHNKEGVGAPFKGIYESVTVFKAGTRIVIKGVRA